MTSTSSLAALLLTAEALVFCALLGRLFRLDLPAGRFSTIDGLRGFLAFGVFLHHSSIWYFYIGTGAWQLPPSRLFVHLGQTSVCLFFMITGFLFCSKILKDGPRTDWLKLFVSRFLRLTPLYAFAVVVMLAIVGTLSHWQLRTSPGALVWSALKWFLYSGADVNGHVDTGIIFARVTWTLQYEWAFYLLLPLLFLLPARPNWRYILVGLGGLIYAFAFRLDYFVALPFIGGMATAWLVRHARVREVARHPASSVLLIALFGLVVSQFDTPYHLAPIFLLSVAFLIIAGGNGFFGIFESRASKILGEMTYSIYLLHGILLFCTFTFLVDRATIRQLDIDHYWLLIGALVPVLLAITFTTFRVIETPPLRMVGRITAKLRSQRAAPPISKPCVVPSPSKSPAYEQTGADAPTD